MKAMKPFYFAHPQYGKLRVVVIGRENLLLPDGREEHLQEVGTETL